MYTVSAFCCSNRKLTDTCIFKASRLGQRDGSQWVKASTAKPDTTPGLVPGTQLLEGENQLLHLQVVL